ncbi:uncharacterized protein LOC117109828 [Anneissia japonica]|uniref:uncharacterized protein LOC117109828 n=1 Tax=Anneissia japonica TaxID=1529436 RepID=UPI001425A5C9|nr:uncharacterized protein LOC117109828 [Anneissia japonica]
MPQKYTRKTDRASWSHENMQKAIDACRKGEMGIRKASKVFNIPKSTIANKVKLPADSDISVQFGRKPCLGKEQEAKLAELIIQMQGHGSGLAKKDVRSLAFEFAEQNQLVHDFNQDTKIAGRFWLEGFLKRHPNIVLKKAKNLAKAKPKEVVAKYFKQLGKLLDQEGMHQTPEKFYNVDEIRISITNSQGKGKRSVVGAEKDENVAVVGCCSATGHYIPPYVIMKGKCMQEEYKDGLPPGSKLVMSDTSSRNNDLFLDWLKYFRRHCVQGKVLLLDGHESHIKSTAILQYCIDNGIILVSVPGHTTRYLQPLDQSVRRSLKINFQKSHQFIQAHKSKSEHY